MCEIFITKNIDRCNERNQTYRYIFFIFNRRLNYNHCVRMNFARKRDEKDEDGSIQFGPFYHHTKVFLINSHFLRQQQNKNFSLEIRTNETLMKYFLIFLNIRNNDGTLSILYVLRCIRSALVECNYQDIPASFFHYSVTLFNHSKLNIRTVEM